MELPKMIPNCDLKKSTQPMARAMTVAEAPPGLPTPGLQAPGCSFNKEAPVPNCDSKKSIETMARAMTAPEAPPGLPTPGLPAPGSSFNKEAPVSVPPQNKEAPGLGVNVKMLQYRIQKSSGGYLSVTGTVVESTPKYVIIHLDQKYLRLQQHQVVSQNNFKWLAVLPKAMTAPTTEEGVKKAEMLNSRKLKMSSKNSGRFAANKSGEECRDMPSRKPQSQFLLEQAALEEADMQDAPRSPKDVEAKEAPVFVPQRSKDVEAAALPSGSRVKWLVRALTSGNVWRALKSGDVWPEN